jgi:hypothetical protein
VGKGGNWHAHETGSALYASYDGGYKEGVECIVGKFAEYHDEDEVSGVRGLGD